MKHPLAQPCLVQTTNTPGHLDDTMLTININQLVRATNLVPAVEPRRGRTGNASI